MPCIAAPPLTAPATIESTPAPARRRCVSKSCSKLATSPSRGLAIITSVATTLALILAMLQLADGQPGRDAGNTLFLAAAFNLLFTALYAPLVALFTLRSGFFKAIGALFTTIATGLAYTLGLLFISVVLLVALSNVFG